jgi:hypothetical protein
VYERLFVGNFDCSLIYGRSKKNSNDHVLQVFFFFFFLRKNQSDFINRGQEHKKLLQSQNI